jgi:hypothetical protein
MFGSPGGYQRLFAFTGSLGHHQHENLLSQWRAYCPSRGGVSIAFNVDALEDVAARQGFRLLRCVYDQAEQMRILRRALEESAYLSVAEQAQERWQLRLVEIAPLLKHPGFREEAEWRLVCGPIGQGDPRIKHRPGASMLTPYVELGLLNDAGTLPIDHVTVGPTPHPELSRVSVARFLEGLCSKGRLVSAESRPVTAKLSDLPFRAC